METTIESTATTTLTHAEICTICLETLESSEEEVCFITRLPCKHRYHSKCILEYVKKTRNTHCPICRYEVVESPNVQITMEEYTPAEIERHIHAEEAIRDLRRIRRIRKVCSFLLGIVIILFIIKTSSDIIFDGKGKMR